MNNSEKEVTIDFPTWMLEDEPLPPSSMVQAPPKANLKAASIRKSINSLLYDLSSYNITHKKSPKWVDYVRNAVCPVGFTATVVGSLVVSHWVDTLNGTADGGSLVGLVSCLLSAVIIIVPVLSLHNKMKALTFKPSIDKNDVSLRQNLLRRAILASSCQVLTGRLSELYFLSDNPNIDQRFWKKLDPLLRDICVEEEKSLSDDIIEKTRQEYRAISSK